MLSSSLDITKVDTIQIFRLLGGETFLYKDLNPLIESQNRRSRKQRHDNSPARHDRAHEKPASNLTENFTSARAPLSAASWECPTILMTSLTSEAMLTAKPLGGKFSSLTRENTSRPAITAMKAQEKLCRCPLPNRCEHKKSPLAVHNEGILLTQG